LGFITLHPPRHGGGRDNGGQGGNRTGAAPARRQRLPAALALSQGFVTPRMTGTPGGDSPPTIPGVSQPVSRTCAGVRSSPVSRGKLPSMKPLESMPNRSSGVSRGSRLCSSSFVSSRLRWRAGAGRRAGGPPCAATARRGTSAADAPACHAATWGGLLQPDTRRLWQAVPLVALAPDWKVSLATWPLSATLGWPAAGTGPPPAASLKGC